MATQINGSSVEVWPTDFAGAEHGLTVVSVSTFAFYLIGLLAQYVRPKVADKQQWRWKNISVSLVHAVFSGIGSILW